MAKFELAYYDICSLFLFFNFPSLITLRKVMPPDVYPLFSIRRSLKIKFGIAQLKEKANKAFFITFYQKIFFFQTANKTILIIHKKTSIMSICTIQ